MNTFSRPQPHIPQDMPLGKLRGLGGKLGAALEQHCGATTAGQVQALGMELLAKHLGPERARWAGALGACNCLLHVL